MQTKYGRAAVLATHNFVTSIANSPMGAWKLAVTSLFPDSTSAQSKGCPRGAYLGLCEEGMVKGIAPGSYTASKQNKSYALQAYSLLLSDSSLSKDSQNLWKKVIGGGEKVHNNQMDVVLALWESGLLAR